MHKLLDMKILNTFVRCMPKDPTIEHPFKDNNITDKTLLKLSRKRRLVLEGIYSWTFPESNKDPTLISVSKKCMDILNIDFKQSSTKEFLNIFSGNELLRNSCPWSQCYSGFQFGVYAGQLGDGRAISLAEIVTEKGSKFELQLKGAGETPYSRFGDGYAVLRSSIREYLVSEANSSLKIPTSRALTLIKTTTKVQRESLESGAIICRVAPSWIRFGTFEHAYYNENIDLLKKIADYVIYFNFNDLIPSHILSDQNKSPIFINEQSVNDFLNMDKIVFNNLYIDLYYRICSLNGVLVAHWQSNGFCHGVLNTDNMSILGITIDYGPYGFLEEYDYDWTPNLSDIESRYCFKNQPQVVKWNLAMLGRALSPLFEMSPDDYNGNEALLRIIKEGMNKFNRSFEKKLGINENLNNLNLVESLLELMFLLKIDYSMFFRRLSESIEKIVDDSSTESFKILLSNCSSLDKKNHIMIKNIYKIESFITEYRNILINQSKKFTSDIKDSYFRELTISMKETNPRFLLKNWILQEVIEAAEKGDYSKLELIYTLTVEYPFSDNTEIPFEEIKFKKGIDISPEIADYYSGKVPAHSKNLKCSCSS